MPVTYLRAAEPVTSPLTATLSARHGFDKAIMHDCRLFDKISVGCFSDINIRITMTVTYLRAAEPVTSPLTATMSARHGFDKASRADPPANNNL